MSDETLATDNGETQNTAAEAVDTTSTAAPETTTTEVPENEDKSLKGVLSRNFDKLTAAKPADAATPAAKPPLPADVDPISGRKLDPIKQPMLPIPLREKWGTLSREWQEYLSKRENDMSTRLNNTAEDRKLADRYKQVVQPYEGLFKQHGIDSIQHINGLLQVNHALHAGSVEQKAQILFNLVNQFIGQDPRGRQIFGGLLTGKVQHIPGAAPPVAPEKSVDDLVEERIQARSSEAELASGQQALEAFLSDPANEFANDDEIKEAMGAALEAGFVKGNSWPELWANAYKFACNNHDGVKAVLAQRAAAQPAPATTTTAAPAKPVQSVKPSAGSGARTNVNLKGKSLREQIEAAMDQHSR